jgi:hypothetical protein
LKTECWNFVQRNIKKRKLLQISLNPFLIKCV